jgi:hypothetical protein
MLPNIPHQVGNDLSQEPLTIAAAFHQNYEAFGNFVLLPPPIWMLLERC